jgi:hypothetical protein
MDPVNSDPAITDPAMAAQQCCIMQHVNIGIRLLPRPKPGTDPAITDPAITDPAITDPAITDPAIAGAVLADSVIPRSQSMRRWR